MNPAKDYIDKLLSSLDTDLSRRTTSKPTPTPDLIAANQKALARLRAANPTYDLEEGEILEHFPPGGTAGVKDSVYTNIVAEKQKPKRRRRVKAKEILDSQDYLDALTRDRDDWKRAFVAVSKNLPIDAVMAGLMEASQDSGKAEGMWEELGRVQVFDL